MQDHLQHLTLVTLFLFKLYIHSVAVSFFLRTIPETPLCVANVAYFYGLVFLRVSVQIP